MGSSSRLEAAVIHYRPSSWGVFAPMEKGSPGRGPVRFGEFEADFRAGELCKHGCTTAIAVGDLNTSHGRDVTINVVAPFFGGGAMDGETDELWRKFCEQAAVENDTEKLFELAQEINRLLDEKEKKLKKTGS